MKRLLPLLAPLFVAMMAPLLGCSGECPDGQVVHPKSGNCVEDTEPRAPTPTPPRTSPPVSTQTDGGTPDTGAGTDGGAGDGGPPPIRFQPFGRGQVRERHLAGQGAAEVQLEVSLADEGALVWRESSVAVPSTEAGPCWLRVKELQSGARTPLLTGEVTILAGGVEVALELDADGILRPRSPPAVGLLSGVGMVSLVVAASTDPAAMLPLTLSASSPVTPMVLEPLGGVVTLEPPPAVAWVPLPRGSAQLALVLATDDQAVTLTCDLADDGRYVPDAAAIEALKTAAAGRPITLELRYETFSVGTGTLPAAIFAVDWRVSSGVSFPTQ